jgi:ribonucleoside-diphosphate reductase beta chain
MRLYRQARRAGEWDPGALDLAADRDDWGRLRQPERDLLLRLTALFWAGEAGMTGDAAPLLATVARERRVDEELFLGTLLADEAKHTQFFRRVLTEVCGAGDALDRFQTPSFRALFSEELPRAVGKLLDDPSPAAQAEAFVTYSVISEGVLSETGHHLYLTALRHRGALPGLVEGLLRVKRDEARHLTYGVYYLARLVAQDPVVWQAIERRMNVLLAVALGIITEFFEPYRPVPFGLTLEDTVSYAMARFARRSARIERAKERGAAIALESAEPADEVAEWLGEQLGPVAVTLERDGAGGASLIRVHQGGGHGSLAIAGDVLEGYLADEILSALEEEGVAGRFGTEPEVRLACTEVSGRLIVQPQG